MDSDDDPGDWSIDQVVHELCQNPTPSWSPADRPQLIPDRENLEDTLRRNHVDGDNLLALDIVALKDDLGIASFGQRRAIMRAIEYFRAHSSSWQQFALQADSASSMQLVVPSAYATPQLNQARTSAGSLTPYAGLGLFPYSQTTGPPTTSPLLRSAAGQLALTTSKPVKDALWETNNATFTAAANASTKATFQSTPSSSIRQPMLNSSAPSIPESSRVVDLMDVDTRADSPASAFKKPSQTSEVAKGKKKIAPTLVTQTDEVPLVGTGTDVTYLSPSSVPVQDIFYGKISTDFGDIHYRVPVDGPDDFFFSGQLPAGQRREVASRIKYFLFQGVIELPRTKTLIKLPYRHSRLQESVSERYFTMFPQGSAQARVFRVDDYPEVKAIASRGPALTATNTLLGGHGSDINEGPLKGGSQNESDWHDLDYLLDKYPAAGSGSDDLLPVYGDSGDEGNLDEETWREIEEERAEKVRSAASMTRAEVESVVDEAVAEIKQEWRDTKLVKAQSKAYRLWMQAAKKKSRREELAYVNREKARFEKMQAKIKRALADEVWRTPADIKKQCQSIELAVFQYEEFDYFNQVLLQDHPPQRPAPAAPALGKPRARQSQASEESGEEVLDSESELIEEDGHFLVDESSRSGSIHHKPDPDWNPIMPQTSKGVGTRSSTRDPSSTPFEATGEGIGSAMLVDTHANGNDADVESEISGDEIVTPGRRRKKHGANATMSSKRAGISSPGSVISLPSRPRSREPESANSDLDRPLRLPHTKHVRKGQTEDEPVDLTFSSPAHETPSTDFDVHTPELNPDPVQTEEKRKDRDSSVVSLSSSSTVDSVQLASEDDSGLPSIEDVQGLLTADWSAIEALCDHRRALAKAVYGLGTDCLIHLSKYARLQSTSSKRTGAIFQGLLYSNDHRHGGRLLGIDMRHANYNQFLALLYVTYVWGQNMMEGGEFTQAHRDRVREEMHETVDPFYHLLSEIIQNFMHKDGPSLRQESIKKRKRGHPQADFDAEMSDDQTQSDADGEGTSSDALLPDAPSSAHKKRKRVVHDSQQAITMRKSDRARIQEQEQRRQQLAMKLAQMAEAGDHRQPINTIEPYIYLHPHIAKRVKPHQVNGIQFMWREIIEDPKHQGCILAHTMGLGKTMQVISFLVTISLCTQSSDPKIRDLIPERLRSNKILILCPASLVENWVDELLLWTPDNTLGTIYKLESSSETQLSEWSRHGGVLIVGYERFRLMITRCIAEKKKGPVSVDAEKIFLKEPALVIADEAHKLKNTEAAVSHLAMRFKTTSRIAVTGSPLSNNLREYHSMVDWIAPGYLGSVVQFKAKYMEPIAEGLFNDSTPYERRLSLRRLHVLKRDLEPKICRADISVIANDMPPKTEFFITVPLTDLQKQAYDIYVKYMLDACGSGRGVNQRLWDWITMMAWLCHHPAPFYMKLKERLEIEAKGRQAASSSPSAEDDTGTSTGADAGPSTDATKNQQTSDALTPAMKEDVEVDTSGPLRIAMQEVLELFGGFEERGVLEDPALSYRTLAVQQILTEASKHGDKTLLFTHSIPTMNYLAKMMEDMQLPFFRLDGSSPANKRQAATKEFNQTNKAKVFLISMKAGGLGLNLQGANRIVIFDFSYNPSWEEQAIGRAYRINSKTPVFVYRFQAGGTYEDVLFNSAVFKTQLFGRVVDKRKPRPQAHKFTKDYLFPVKDVPQQDFTDCRGKDPKVLDVVVQRLDCFRSIVLTETFQKEDDEQLNDEEEKAAEEELNDQRLQREDPAAYQAALQAKQAKAAQETLAAYASVSANRPMPPPRAPKSAQPPRKRPASRRSNYAAPGTYSIDSPAVPLAAINNDLGFPPGYDPSNYVGLLSGTTGYPTGPQSLSYADMDLLAQRMGYNPQPSAGAPQPPPPPPFTRSDFDNYPRPPPPLPPPAPPLPGTGVREQLPGDRRQSYDDTYQDFPQQPDTRRRASSLDPDVNMS